MYPDTMQMDLVNVDLGVVADMDADLCPSLGMFLNCYGEYAEKWMMMQLSVINIVANVSNRLNDTQIRMLANDIMREYYYFNLVDIMVFLGRLRRARYGEFYNAVGYQRIMDALRSFRDERREEIDYYERQKTRKSTLQESEERKRNAITYEEYVRRLEAQGKKPSEELEMLERGELRTKTAKR